MNHAAPKRRIALDSTGLVWKVEKGEAGIMVEPAPESDLPRAAHTLVRLRKGQCAFGISSEGMEGKVRVFIETTPGAELTPMLTEDFIQRCKAAPEDATTLVDAAVRQLATHLSPDIPPPDVTKMLGPGSNFRLPAKSQVSAVEGLWLRMDTGSAQYGGTIPSLTGDETLFRPLVGNLWLNMEESGRIICIDTKSLVAAGAFFEAFAAFAALAVTASYESFSDMALKKFMRQVESSRHRNEKFSKALHQAASILNPDADENSQSRNATDAIRAIARSWGHKVEPPPRLKPDLDEQIEDILGHNGFYSRDVALEGPWWESDAGPLLGFTDVPGSGRQAVALVPDKQGYIALAPESRLRVTPENAADFGETARQIYPPLPPGTPGPLALTLHSIKGCRREQVMVGLMGLLGGLCGFGIPMAMSATVDKVITNGEFAMLGQIVFGLSMIVLGNGVFEFTKNRALLRVETRAQVSLQSSIFGKLLRLPVDFFKDYPAGDLSNRVMAVDGIRQSLSGAAMVAMLSSTFALTNLALLAVYSWKLSLAVLAMLAITLGFTYLLMKNQMRFQAKVQNVIGKLAGLELQLVTGINKLRAAGAEANAFSRWMDHFSELRGITFAIGKATNVVTVYSSSLPLFTSVLVFGLFIFSGMYRELSLGSFLCFNSALGQLTAAVAALCNMSMTLLFIKPMYQRAKPILDATPETNPALEDPGELTGAVETVGVSFAYKNAQQLTLQGVTFKAAPGEFVAIVGPSGSGKSTLLKLLLGLYQPSAGSVLYDGKPLRRLDPVRVRRQVGSVIQNGELIQGNLFFNIMGATADAEEEDAWEAARLAAVDEDIKQMPMGMHTFVPHGGGTFSGGQRQRIMLARALSKKPRVFLLDEATSCLDNTTQATVMSNLRRINATRIVVAHRLSTIVNADRIYVMQAGRIIESGTHEELMEKNGLFSRLASRQLQ